MKKLWALPIFMLLLMQSVSALDTGESILIFGSMASLVFTIWFLVQISSFIENTKVKSAIVALAGILIIVNLGYVAAALQVYLTITTLASFYGSLFILFTFLMIAASVFIMIKVVLFIIEAFKIKRGLKVK